MHIVLLSTSGKDFHSYRRDYMTHEPKILNTNTCSETNMDCIPWEIYQGIPVSLLELTPVDQASLELRGLPLPPGCWD